MSAAALALTFGTPAAYAIARFEFKTWKNTDITIWFLSQRILPPVATVIPFYLIMRYLNLLDTHLALILIDATFILPFVVVILRQTFLELPRELEESALVDGSELLDGLLADRLAAGSTHHGGDGPDHLRVQLERLHLRDRHQQSENVVTIPVHIAGAVDTRGVQFWFMGVRAMIAVIPPVLIALLAQRYIVRGLTLGAVKG